METAVHAIETEQVRIGLDRGEIVDGDDLDVGALRFDDGAQNVAANTPEPVDRHLHGHVSLQLLKLGQDLAPARARVQARNGRAAFNESDNNVTIRRNGE
jgi:hypothetical protein